MSVKKKWDFEITNVIAFAREYPDLVTIEPKRREILEALNAGTFDYTLNPDEQCVTPEALVKPGVMRTAPGMRFFQKDDIKVR